MFEKPRIRSILFATDLSKNATYAFSYAVGMAVAHGARVTILYVLEEMAPVTEVLLSSILGYGDPEEFRRSSQIDLIVRIKEHIKQFCIAAGDEVPACLVMLKEVVVEPGNIVGRILHHAGTGKYDLLVLGSRGQGILKMPDQAGTSRKVVQDSPIPVLIVPPQRHSDAAMSG